MDAPARLIPYTHRELWNESEKDSVFPLEILKEIFTSPDIESKNARNYLATISLVCKGLLHQAHEIKNCLLEKGLIGIQDILTTRDHDQTLRYLNSQRYTPCALKLDSLILSKSLVAEVGKLSHLTSLELNKCDNKEKIRKITLPNLSKLILSYCNSTMEAFLANITQKSTRLSMLDLNNSQISIDKNINLSPLSYLKLENSGVRDSELAEISRMCTNLTSLHLYYNDFKSDGFLQIAKLTNLTFLNLGHNRVKPEDFVEIAKLTSLTSLSLYNNRNITTDGFSKMHQLHMLTELDLNFSAIKDEEIEKIGELSNLSQLKLRSSLITANGLTKIIMNFPHLSKVDLTRSKNITDEDLLQIDTTYLKPHQRLSSLSLVYCEKITNTGLCVIGTLCPHLTFLDFSLSGKMTNEGLSSTAHTFRKLSSIKLLTSRAVPVKGFAKFESLTSIALSQCNELTDQDLIALGECNKLFSLEIKYCHKITDSGVAQLKDALPDLRYER